MIFGDYPCCQGSLAIVVPDRCPVYFSEDCPHCGATVWHRLSRLDAESWTEADFLAEHDIDYETRIIKRKEEAK